MLRQKCVCDEQFRGNSGTRPWRLFYRIATCRPTSSVCTFVDPIAKEQLPLFTTAARLQSAKANHVGQVMYNLRRVTKCKHPIKLTCDSQQYLLLIHLPVCLVVIVMVIVRLLLKF